MNRLLKRLLSIPRDRGICILTHRRADPDAVASALLLKKFLRYIGFKKIFILHPEGISRRTLDLIHKVGVSWRYHEDIEELESLVYIVVDTGSPELLGDYLKYVERSKDVIWIDHHLLKGKVREFEYYVDENASSTVEIIMDAIMPIYSINNLKVGEARFIASAIYIETKRLSIASYTSMYWIFHILRRFGISIRDIQRYIVFEVDTPYYPAVIKALARAKWFVTSPTKFYIVVTHSSGYQNIISATLQRLGIDLSIIYSYKKGMKIHMRCREGGIERIHDELIHEILGRLEKKGIKPSHGGHRRLYNIEVTGRRFRRDYIERIVINALENTIKGCGYNVGEIKS